MLEWIIKTKKEVKVAVSCDICGLRRESPVYTSTPGTTDAMKQMWPKFMKKPNGETFKLGWRTVPKTDEHGNVLDLEHWNYCPTHTPTSFEPRYNPRYNSTDVRQAHAHEPPDQAPADRQPAPRHSSQNISGPHAVFVVDEQAIVGCFDNLTSRGWTFVCWLPKRNAEGKVCALFRKAVVVVATSNQEPYDLFVGMP